MAQLVVATAAAVVGFYIGGPQGAQIGWTIGSMIGASFAPAQKSAGPRLTDLTLTGSAYGAVIPYVVGHPRIAGQIVWASAKREISTTTTTEQGKGGPSAEYTTYTYEIDLLIKLTDNMISSVPRVWNSGKLVYTSLSDATDDSVEASAAANLWTRFTVYTGAADQLPDPTYEAAVGTDYAPAYRGAGTVFIQGLQLGSGGQLPNLTFEVSTQDILVDPKTRLQTEFAGASSADVSYFDLGPAAKFGDGVIYDGYYEIDGNSGSDPVLSWSDSGLHWVTGTPLTVEFTLKAIGSVLPGQGDIFIARASVCAATDIVFTINGYGATTGQIDIYNQGSGPQTAAHVGSTIFGREIHFALVFDENCLLDIYVEGIRRAQGLNAGGSGGSGFVEFGRLFGSVLGEISIKYYGVRIKRTKVYTGASFTPPTSFGPPDPPRHELTEPTVMDTVSALCLNSNLTADQFDVTALSSINRPVRAMAISQISSSRTVCETLMSTYFFDSVLSDKLYFRPRGQASVSTITFDELGVIVEGGTNVDPFPLRMTNELEIPAQMALTYSNVNGDYQTDTQYSDRLLTGQESTNAVQVPLGFTASEAKKIVDAMLFDAAVGSVSAPISIGNKFSKLEPSDVITVIAEDYSAYRLRITKRTDADKVLTLNCVVDDISILTQLGETVGGTSSQTVVYATPDTDLELLDIPLMRDVDNLPGHYVAVKGSNASWLNSGLFESQDNSNFALNTTIFDQAVMGTAITALADYLGGNFPDEKNTVTVNVGSGQLSSITHEAMISNAYTNLILLGNEVLQYRDAELISTGVYKLSGLIHGKHGTEWAQTGHVVGERFVLLTTSGMRFIARKTSEIGSTLYYKAVSAGQRASAVTSESLVEQSINLKPLAPTNLRSERLDAGGIQLTWDRRTRVSENWLAGTLPLGESTEAYAVDIVISSVVVRTLLATSATVEYELLDQYADHGASVTAFTARVYQISSTVGRGTVLESTFNLATHPDGSSFPGGASITLFPAVVANGVMIAVSSAIYTDDTLFKVFESYDNGATFTQLSGAGAYINSIPYYTASLNDGTYISLGSLADPDQQDVYLTRGVTGSAPVVSSVKFTRPYLPVAIGSDGSKFVVMTQGNKVYTSTDGQSFTLQGTASGLPFTFFQNPGTTATNYGSGVPLIWMASRWFIRMGIYLYYTTNANALTGWTACILPTDDIAQQNTNIAEISGVLFMRGAKTFTNAPSVQLILKSTDSGSNWTESLYPMAASASDVFNLSGNLASVGFFYESKTYISSNSGSSWSYTSNGVSMIYPTPVIQIGSSIVVAAARVGGGSGDPPQQIMYSTDGITFTNSLGV